jgi:hypothetical protein
VRVTREELAEIRERYNTQDMSLMYVYVNTGQIFEDIPKLLREVQSLRYALHRVYSVALSSAAEMGVLE